MNTQSRKSPVLIVVAILAMIALTSLACSFGSVRINATSPVVEVTINQDMFNQKLSSNDGVHLTEHCNHVLDHLTRIELHDGYIRFLGTKVQPDGSEVKGSLDLSLTAKNDALKAEITALDIPGIDLNSRCIVEANQELDDEFARLLTQSDDGVLFKEVVVEEGVLRMKVQVHIDE